MAIFNRINVVEQIKLSHILCFALTVRLTAFLILPDQNFPDSHAYHQAGRILFERGVYGTDYYMPVYGIISYLMGGDATLRLFDVIVSVATVWLIFRLAEIVWGSAVAPIIAGVVAAIYPHFIFFALSELTETIFMALICGTYLLYYKRRWIPGHFVLVLSILTKPSVELLAPLLILTFAIIVHRMTYRQALAQVSLLALVYVILMSPWWYHNYQRYGEFVRLAPSDGYPLYAGNNPMNQTGGGLGMSNGTGDVDFTGFKQFQGAVEKNTALRDAALDYIANNPMRFVEMAGIKFIRFWRLWPYAPQYKTPLTIIVSLASYGICLIFSIASLFMYIRTRWRPLIPMLMFAAYLTAVHMITIGSVRYRIPIEPFLLVIASASMVTFLSRFGFVTVDSSAEPKRGANNISSKEVKN